MLSVVDHPWGKYAKEDMGLDPVRNDIIGKEEDIGCRRARNHQDDWDRERGDVADRVPLDGYKSNWAWMRDVTTKEPSLGHWAALKSIYPGY